jgi:hypothetical protein
MTCHHAVSYRPTVTPPLDTPQPPVVVVSQTGVIPGADLTTGGCRRRGAGDRRASPVGGKRPRWCITHVTARRANYRASAHEWPIPHRDTRKLRFLSWSGPVPSKPPLGGSPRGLCATPAPLGSRITTSPWTPTSSVTCPAAGFVSPCAGPRSPWPASPPRPSGCARLAGRGLARHRPSITVINLFTPPVTYRQPPIVHLPTSRQEGAPP